MTYERNAAKPFNWSDLIQWSGQLPRIIIYNVNTVEIVRNILPRIIVYNVNTVDLFPSFFEKIELSQGSLFIMWKQGYVQKSSDHQTEAKNPPNYTLEVLVARSYTTKNNTHKIYLPITGLWFPVETMPKFKNTKK